MNLNAHKVNSILNKIATFERSKHLDEKTKDTLITQLKGELAQLTGQLSLTEEPRSLEGGETQPPGGETTGKKRG